MTSSDLHPHLYAQELKLLRLASMEKLQLSRISQSYVHSFSTRHVTQASYISAFSDTKAKSVFGIWNCPFSCKLIQENRLVSHNLAMVAAIRRRRSNTQTDTYVLMEPDKNEEFVTEEELCQRLKGWLEKWPGDKLPPDLARYDNIEDAVRYLVKSVCELEIDGDVGSIQWYQVRLD